MMLGNEFFIRFNQKHGWAAQFHRPLPSWYRRVVRRLLG
jgi:hypothetical protein